MKLKLFFLLLLLLPSFASRAQHTLTKEQTEDKMVASKIWKPFTLTKSYPVFNHATFNFSDHHAPVFLYVGQKSCVICSYEFPTYAQVAKEFPEINFVYLTPDDSSDIVRKFGKSLQLPNLYVIQFPIDQLWNKDIAKVFPVKYFISRSGVVVDASTGGTMKDRPALKKKWIQKLNNLRTEK